MFSHLFADVRHVFTKLIIKDVSTWKQYVTIKNVISHILFCLLGSCLSHNFYFIWLLAVNAEVASDTGPPDYVAVTCTIVLFFVVFFVFTIFET